MRKCEDAVRQQVKAPFKSGGTGWVLLAGLVIVWDVMAPETMSAAFQRACSTTAGRVAVTGAWGLLTAHLFAQLPERYDPMHLWLEPLRARRVARECSAV